MARDDARSSRAQCSRVTSIRTDATAGADGLLLLPYLNTAGSPHLNAQTRGAFIGITQNHDRAHVARTVMEGRVAAGVFKTIQDIAAMVRAKHTLRPDPVNQRRYTDVYLAYADAYHALAASAFGGIAQIQETPL